MGPILYDAVTLQHFAAVSRLDILRTRHKSRPAPRWTYGVYQEIKRAANTIPHCTVIVEENWLDEPIVPTERQAEEIDLIRMSIMDIDDAQYAHLGEAQSIYFAKQLQGQFATDDNAAYKFASQRYVLGNENVIDSIRILQEAVAMHEITDREADQIARNMEENGRYFRPIHRQPRGPDYFAI